MPCRKYYLPLRLYFRILNKSGLNERQVDVLLFFKGKGEIISSEYATKYNVADRTARRDLSELCPNCPNLEKTKIKEVSCPEFALLSKIGTSGANIWYEMVGQMGQ